MQADITPNASLPADHAGHPADEQPPGATASTLIGRSQEASRTPAWQRQLSAAIRDPFELCRRLGLGESWLAGAMAGHALFQVCVPEAFLARIEAGNPDDPLLRQVLPLSQETHSVTGFVDDPLQEVSTQTTRGLIHKYPGRVLLIASPTCAINCRYCFRRHFPYADNAPSRRQWEGVLDHIAQDPSISEVILSGGDPLASSDQRLGWLVDRLDQIPHLKRLRVHTRLPVVIPDRVDDALLDWFGNTRLQRVCVLHVNHAQEVDAEVEAACQRLSRQGIQLLNQSVLLGGVNDSVDALEALSERLFEAGVLPYYLHVLDPVAGAAHFDLDDDRARALVAGLRARAPGYLVPRLVREVPGESSKTPL